MMYTASYKYVGTVGVQSGKAEGEVRGQIMKDFLYQAKIFCWSWKNMMELK